MAYKNILSYEKKQNNVAAKINDFTVIWIITYCGVTFHTGLEARNQMANENILFTKNNEMLYPQK